MFMELQMQNSTRSVKRKSYIEGEIHEILNPIDMNISPTILKRQPTKRIKLDLKPCSPPLITDLPNFNVDGSAPHLSESPVKKADKDWLTKLRMQRKIASRVMEQIALNSPPKKQRSDSDNEAGSDCRSRRRTRTASKRQSPLLKFFRVTNSRQNGISKSNNIVTASPKNNAAL